jgi:putative spermidine/putrescine transport system substrate-binding protein
MLSQRIFMISQTVPGASAVAAPAIHTSGKPHLRVLGTEITMLESIRSRAEADLGITLTFERQDFLSAQQRAAMHPEAYDVYDQSFHNLDIVWFWRAIQPIDTQRIPLWGEVSGLTKVGRLTPDAPLGAGSIPAKRMYVQPDGTLGGTPTRQISMLPTVHNMDAFAVTESLLAEFNEPPSWRWLLDPRVSGRAGLVDEPAIGIFDAALAARASGEFHPEDLGNLSIREIDQLISLLAARQKHGHFSGFWKTAADSVAMIESGRVAIQSIWSPAMATLAAHGQLVLEMAPVEGYRAWHGGMSLSRHLKGRMLDVAYEYLNWWLSGWPGSVMARQGYYMSAPHRVREWLASDEWDYWYEGKPASCDLVGPDQKVVVRQGQARPGGSYWRRASHIAIWNTTMDEHNYLVRRWREVVY